MKRIYKLSCNGLLSESINSYSTQINIIKFRVCLLLAYIFSQEEKNSHLSIYTHVLVVEELLRCQEEEVKPLKATPACIIYTYMCNIFHK